MVIHSLLQSFAQYCWGGSNLKSVCSFYGFLLIYKFIYCMSSEFWILVQKCSVIQSKSHSIEKIIPVSLCFGCSSFTVCTVYFFFPIVAESDSEKLRRKLQVWLLNSWCPSGSPKTTNPLILYPLVL